MSAASAASHERFHDRVPFLPGRVPPRGADQYLSGGDTCLESLTLEDNQDQQEEVPAAAIFIMIGAKPHTDWLAPALSRDKDGFVLTGRDIPGQLGAGA